MDRFALRKLLRWFAPLAAVLALWLGYRHFTDAPDKPEAREAEVPLPKRRAPVVFRDGRWVTLSPEEWDAFVRERSRRAPGLLKVRGTVRQSDTGEPVPGAEVVFAGELGESSVVADNQGAYTLEISPGFYRAFARADGYVAVGIAPLERLPTEPDPTAVGVPKSELAPALAVFRDLTSVDMFLRRGAEVYGTVYDQNGVPVAGAIVVARQTGYADWRTRLVLGTDMDETGLDGTFRLQVPAGTIVLQATHSEFAGLTAESTPYLILSPGDRMRVDLTMQRGCIIAGQVIDQRGAPVGEGSLEIWTGGEPPNDYLPVGKVEAGGRFRLARTEPGNIRLRAWPWKSPPSTPQELSCTEGTRHTGITLVVPDAEPDIQGMVLSAKGEPIPFAYLDLTPLFPGGMAQQERADEYGDWAFFSLSPGEYQVTASVSGHGAAAHTVTAPSRGNRITLSGTGSLKGTVSGVFEGSFTFRIERCLLSTQDGLPARIEEFTLPQATQLVAIERGRYQIDDLPACPIQAIVVSKDRSWPMEVEIVAGRVAELDLDLREPQRKRVFGRVIDANGRPVIGATVVRVPGPGSPRDQPFYSESTADGAYEVEAYSGDTLRVHGAGGYAEVAVTWEGQDSERIDIELQP